MLDLSPLLDIQIHVVTQEDLDSVTGLSTVQDDLIALSGSQAGISQTQRASIGFKGLPSDSPEPSPTTNSMQSEAESVLRMLE